MICSPKSLVVGGMQCIPPTTFVIVTNHFCQLYRYFGNNNIYLDYFVPSITRIGQLTDEMGKMAVKLLHNSICNKQVVRSQIELSPELILRDSVIPLIKQGAEH